MGGRDSIVAMLILMTAIWKKPAAKEVACAKTLQFEIYARADSNANNDTNERFVSKKKGDVPD